MGASSSEHVYCRPRSRASPIVSLEGKKFVCRTLMYEMRGLSTSKAWLNSGQVEYTGSTLRIKWDTQSCPSQCTKISDLSTKFRSQTCTTLRSFLNLLLSTWEQHKNWLVITWSIQNRQINKIKLRKYIWDWPTSRGENAQGSSSASQSPHTRTNSPAEFLFESSRHEISHTLMSLVFK